MALKTTIFTNKKTPQNISINTPNLGLLSRFKKSVKKARFISLLIILVFSFKGNAQCTITGTPVNINSSSILCNSFSSCTIIYVGDGINPTNLVMNQNLNFWACIATPIQFIIRNNATIDFSNGNNYDLTLPPNSSIIFETGGKIITGSNCSASDLIKIGDIKVASCTGNNALTNFPDLVAKLYS